MSAANTSAAPAATPAPAANAKGGLLGGITSLFGGKPANAKNASANAGANAKNAGANAKNAGANAKNASANANANVKNAGANANANKNSPPPLQPVEVAKSLNAPAKTRRRQRGGARGKTMRLPGPRNVLRVTGKTVGKVRNVGVYGLKKVGNGVHLVTGLIGKGTGLLGSVLRKGGKTLKNLTKRRQQTRKQ
jgi:hypothetical protein